MRHPRRLDVLAGTGTPRQQEERLATVCGGRRVPGSGASVYARGDVKTRQYLVECKQTEKDSIRVTWAWLEKITRQAFAEQRIPLLAFEVRCKSRRDPLTESEWIACPLSEWERLQELSHACAKGDR